MTNEEHTPEDRKGIEQYLSVLKLVQIPEVIATSVAAIREQYDVTQRLRPTQIAVLQRCFRRAIQNQYEVDWYPIGSLDIAIAKELDGTPCRMLCPDDTALALQMLGTFGNGRVGARAVAEIKDIERQLLLTGWLSREQIESLKNIHRLSLERCPHTPPGVRH